ncbi:MAG: O-antigen ligase family protein [Patescibacteria group bacterium]
MKKKCFIWIVRLWLFCLPIQTHLVLKSAVLAGHDWPLGETSLYFLDILFVLMGIAALLARNSWRPVFTKHLIGFVTFVGLIAVSVFLHHDALNTWVLFLRYIEGLFVVAILAVVPDKTRNLFIAFIAGMTLSSLFGIWQFAVQYVPSSTIFGIAGQMPFVSGVSVLVSSIGRFMRAYGTFSHPNIFAGYLAVAILMLLIVVLRRNHVVGNGRGWVYRFCVRHGWIVVALILFAALAFSFSRSAWLGLAFGLIILVAVTMKRNYSYELRTWVIALCVPLIFLVINSSIFIPLISERVVARESVEQVSLEDRHRSLVEGLDIIQDHWAEGIGLGRSTYYIEQHSPGSLHWWEIQPPHNIFVLLAVEASVFTALAFIVMLFLLARDSYTLLKSKRHEMFPLSAFGLSGLVLVIVIGLFDHYLVTLPSGLFLLFVVCGFAIRGVHTETS